MVLSSGHVIRTSTVSPTDYPRIFKNKYSISKVESFSTFVPLVKIHFFKTSLTAVAICFESCDSIAKINIFSSFTRKGLNLIFLSEDGKVNSYVGVEMVGKGIIF